MAHAVKIRISWILLVLVCFLWFLDCITRPEADPFIARIGNLVIDLSPEKSEESFIYRIGSWLVKVGSDDPESSTTTVNNTTYNTTTTTTTTVTSTSKSALVGRWKSYNVRTSDGTDMSHMLSLILDLKENGAFVLEITETGTRTQSGTGTWLTSGNKIYFTATVDYRTETSSATYSLSGSTLTLTQEDGSVMSFSRTR